MPHLHAGVLLLELLPALVVAGMARHPGARHGHAAGVFQFPSDLRGVFPFPSDLRDPNTAWPVVGRVIFLTLFISFWAGICVLVRFWDPIKQTLGRCSRRAPRARRREGTVALLSEGTVQAVGEVNVGPETPYPADRCLHELFEDCALQAPSAAALVIPAAADVLRREVSYRTLLDLVDELAGGLASLGVPHGGVVALILGRSIAQVVAVFGTMKAGAVILPVDPEAPASRKQTVLQETEAGVVIVESGDAPTVAVAGELGIPVVVLSPDCDLRGEASGGVGRPVILRGGGATPEMFPDVPRGQGSGARVPPAITRPVPSDVAIIIYTSGTTGTPKGITYTHKFLTHSTCFFAQDCGVRRGSVAFMKSPFFWGAGIWEMYPAVTHGGTLVVAKPNGQKDPVYLARTVLQEKVSVLMMTPAVLDLMLDFHEGQRDVRPLRSVTHILTVGEPLPVALANRVVRAPALRATLLNAYAATETSCVIYKVPPEGVDTGLFPNKVPVGVPQPHAKVYVMQTEPAEHDGEGPTLVPVPTGEVGEICFGGMLASGYYKRDELTLVKFVETQAYGRLYRSGDMGRWRGGVLEVVGRNDRQVKIRGVRVEPEEIEVVLFRFTALWPDADDVESGVGIQPSSEVPTQGGPGPRAALKHVAVVATPEPVELVAFVSPRDGATGVTPEALRAHCVANLTPAYVPKFFLVVPEGLPLLPNGKPNYAALKPRAAQHAEEEGSVVMDSLGRMRKLSRWAILENQVIHRCYAFWMLGVVIDHYNRCALDTDANGKLLGYCSTLASASVPPWTEVLIRGFGNDQTMFGFIMLGAYQDARPDRPGAKPRVKLGWKDLFVFAVYMMMALPFPQLLHYLLGQWAWPHSWDGEYGPWVPKDNWGSDYMSHNSYTSDHRWYLLMVIQARLLLALGELLRMPGWLQVLVVSIPCTFPGAWFKGGEYAWDVCAQGSTAPAAVQYVMAWVFRTFDDSCPVNRPWVQWYVLFYCTAFHFMRPVVGFLARRVPQGSTWAAVSLSASMLIGILMAMFHYPNNTVETGAGTQWAPLELAANIVQPSLLAFAMAYFPLDLVWWGNTTLGCYCFHFYFKDQMSVAFTGIAQWLKWDPTGLILYVVIVGTCVIFTTFLGPIGHYILLSPKYLLTAARRLSAGRRRARKAHSEAVSGAAKS